MGIKMMESNLITLQEQQITARPDNNDTFDGQGTLWHVNADYPTCHNTLVSDFLTNWLRGVGIGQRYNIYGTGDYQIFRSVMRFDLSKLPASATIKSAVMNILASTILSQYRDWDIVLVDGSDCVNPLVKADYGDLLDETTSLGDISALDLSSQTRFNIPLNAAGRAFVLSKAGGVAVFGMRSSEDISSTPPPDYNAGQYTEVTVSSSISADPDEIPKLVVRYT